MKLKNIIQNLDIISMTADPETDISGICYDSRKTDFQEKGHQARRDAGTADW